MAKIRGVKPELWTDENFVELSPYARLLWIGLWNYACDNGHLQDKSKQIKMRVLPTDDVNCAELLREIERQGLIVRDDGWITIPNLPHHQKPHKRWYVLCDKPGCEFPEGFTYGFSKRGSTVEQPLTNGGTTVINGCSTADVDVDVDGDVDGDGEVTTSSSASAGADARPDVEEILDYLDECIHATDPEAKLPSRTKKNLDAARLLLDRDGRTVTNVKAAIDFATGDEFWRPNIRSMSKLRDKYDQLRAQAARGSLRAVKPPSIEERRAAGEFWL